MPRGTQAPIVAPREVIDNTDRVRAFREQGGHILHVRPEQKFDRSKSRGMTLAYAVKGRRAIVAASLTHPNDGFSKKLGTKTALDHFEAGKTIVVPFEGTEALKIGFGFLCR